MRIKEYELTAIAVIVFVVFVFVFVDNTQRWDDYTEHTQNTSIFQADTLKIMKHNPPQINQNEGLIIFDGNRKGIYNKNEYPFSVISKIIQLEEGNVIAVCFRDSTYIFFPEDFLIE